MLKKMLEEKLICLFLKVGGCVLGSPNIWNDELEAPTRHALPPDELCYNVGKGNDEDASITLSDNVPTFETVSLKDQGVQATMVSHITYTAS